MGSTPERSATPVPRQRTLAARNRALGYPTPASSDWQRRHRARRPALPTTPNRPSHGRDQTRPLDKRHDISAAPLVRSGESRRAMVFTEAVMCRSTFALCVRWYLPSGVCVGLLTHFVRDSSYVVYTMATAARSEGLGARGQQLHRSQPVAG